MIGYWRILVNSSSPSLEKSSSKYILFNNTMAALGSKG